MDMDSDPFEECAQKLEPDSDSDSKDATKRDENMHWDPSKTLKLAKTLEKDCRLLWDTKHLLNKDKVARQAKQEYLADMFGTTIEEISRKVHNLRCQFNFQLRKMKRRSELGVKGVEVSGWEFFDALSFLLPTSAPSSARMTAASSRDRFDSSDSNSTPCLIDGVNNTLAEFQEKEKNEFEIRVKTKQNKPASTSSRAPRRRKRMLQSTPPVPIPTQTCVASTSLSSEAYSPTIHSRVGVDECQIFGDFVASELRLLRSDESRRKLKRLVQTAILKVGEEEELPEMEDTETIFCE